MICWACVAFGDGWVRYNALYIGLLRCFYRGDHGLMRKTHPTFDLV